MLPLKNKRKLEESRRSSKVSSLRAKYRQLNAFLMRNSSKIQGSRRGLTLCSLEMKIRVMSSGIPPTLNRLRNVSAISNEIVHNKAIQKIRVEMAKASQLISITHLRSSIWRKSFLQLTMAREYTSQRLKISPQVRDPAPTQNSYAASVSQLPAVAAASVSSMAQFSSAFSIWPLVSRLQE